MSIDFSDLAMVPSGDCFGGPLEAYNHGAVEIVGGRRVSKPSTRVAIAGVIGLAVPIDGNKISQREDGKRLVGGRTIYTVGNPFRVADEKTGLKGTYVVDQGEEFEVIEQAAWVRGGFSEYFAQHRRSDQGV
jgi:hypothetical protein